ncbi:MAG: hypothetical protein AAF460_06550, partial [Pseudomonadota bacterium]
TAQVEKEAAQERALEEAKRQKERSMEAARKRRQEADQEARQQEADREAKLSANAELMIDDGTHLRLGIRMDLAKPNAPRRAALLQKRPEPYTPSTGALTREPAEKENRFKAFFRKLFNPGSEAETLDTEVPAASTASTSDTLITYDASGAAKITP